MEPVSGVIRAFGMIGANDARCGWIGAIGVGADGLRIGWILAIGAAGATGLGSGRIGALGDLRLNWPRCLTTLRINWPRGLIVGDVVARADGVGALLPRDVGALADGTGSGGLIGARVRTSRS